MAVIRSVRLWPDIPCGLSASPLPSRSAGWRGTGTLGAGGLPRRPRSCRTLPLNPAPAPSAPAGSGAGLRPRAPPLRTGKKSAPVRRNQARRRLLRRPPPQFRLSLLVSWSPAGRGTGGCSGGARLLLGAFRRPGSRDGRRPSSLLLVLLLLPPLSPSLSVSAPAPRSARAERGGARALRGGKPARRAQQEARPRGGGVRGPPRHVTLPANRSPEAGLAWGGGGHREGAGSLWAESQRGAGACGCAPHPPPGCPSAYWKRRCDKEEVPSL